ncbi:hypothetical protein YC2023_017218 [Brassica napus]
MARLDNKKGGRIKLTFHVIDEFYYYKLPTHHKLSISSNIPAYLLYKAYNNFQYEITRRHM